MTKGNSRMFSWLPKISGCVVLANGPDPLEAKSQSGSGINGRNGNGCPLVIVRLARRSSLFRESAFHAANASSGACVLESQSDREGLLRVP